jgi:xanthine phosphoribosyltransferase
VRERASIEGDLVKVDSFLNHRVEPDVMRAIGEAIVSAFASDGFDLILTAEASGIPPAMAAASASGVPFVYAKKYPVGADKGPLSRIVHSRTKGVPYLLWIAPTAMTGATRVLIVDDILAHGTAAAALATLASEAGLEVVGVGIVIEKTHDHGRSVLEQEGLTVRSLVTARIADGRLHVGSGEG